MFHSKALLSLILVGLAVVDATPLSRRTGKATLGFATTINERGTLNIAEKDRARAQAFKNTAKLGKRESSASVSVANGNIFYSAQVGVGVPATEYKLLIDTGSSNTWIGASKAYKKTSTSKDTGNAMEALYGSGYVSGEEWTDTVTLGSGLVIKNQSIGIANSSSGFRSFGVDGILGIGPTILTTGIVGNTTLVPTVTDNLRSQGTISEEVIGVYFVPASESTSTGELTFGGHDDSVITSSVEYTPLTTTSPASMYWGIDQSIFYGDTEILSTTAGMVDTGTTLILIATDAFQKYQSATGATLDNSTGLLAITSKQFSNLQTLSFRVGEACYDLSPNAQIWPRSLNTKIGGSSSAIYLVVNDIGSPSGSGLDFFDGFTFLERYYSVFDTTHKRVGFARTAYTDADTN